MKINRSFFMGMLFARAPLICARMDTLLPHVDVLDRFVVMQTLHTVIVERDKPQVANSLTTSCNSEDIGTWYQELQAHIFPMFN